ncbi:MAG: hypothetical protein HY784_07790 [Chloroflexi bacterium]|nr:hypothetical protein [Chloroflexota bacterium]
MQRGNISALLLNLLTALLLLGTAASAGAFALIFFNPAILPPPFHPAPLPPTASIPTATSTSFFPTLPPEWTATPTSHARPDTHAHRLARTLGHPHDHRLAHRRHTHAQPHTLSLCLHASGKRADVHHQHSELGRVQLAGHRRAGLRPRGPSRHRPRRASGRRRAGY